MSIAKVDNNLKDNAPNEDETSHKAEAIPSQIIKENPKINISFLEFFQRIESFDALKESYEDLKAFIEDDDLKLAFYSYYKDIITPNIINADCDSIIKCKYTSTLTLANFSTAYPIEIDMKNGFTISVVSDEESRMFAEKFVQFLMFTSISNAGDLVQCRCYDCKKSGLSFGKFINLIENNKIFSKRLYSGDNEIDSIADSLNKIYEANILKLKGTYSNVTEYNENSQGAGLPYTLAVYCDIPSRGNNSSEIFKKIQANSSITGINQIFLCETSNQNSIGISDFDYSFFALNGKLYCQKNNFYIPVSVDFSIYNEETFNALQDRLNAEKSVDTKIESFFDIEKVKPFTKDSTEYLSVPFGYNDENQIVNMDFAGGIQAHALISGSTGSGKSTTLHTIIEQIMFNYHPDDVELWLVDCKGVEFGCYVNQRTPHITVIGQDNSADFLISFVDLIKAEYERRKALFMNENVRDFQGYRKKFGKRSLSRILIVVDEFHNLTQAVQNYTGETNYKIILENLLKEIRAMGMAFLFCSQTIATGLAGLTESAKNQIGCRLSMKHEDLSEVAETLSISAYSSSQRGFNLEDVKDLAKGQVVYKHYDLNRVDGGYTFERLNVLYISENMRSRMINKINSSIEDGYISRPEITHKDSQRYCVLEKERHPLSVFINKGIKSDAEELTLYPAASTSLKGVFELTLDNESGNNLMVVGTNDDLRESVVLTSVMGLLLDSKNQVVANILDTENDDNIRLKQGLERIGNENLKINFGYNKVINEVSKQKVLKSVYNQRTIYLWYGLNKLKSLAFKAEQEEKGAGYSPDSEQSFVNPFDVVNSQNEDKYYLNMLMNSSSDFANQNNNSDSSKSDSLSYNQCVEIIQNIEEYGPDNNIFNITIYNTVKGLIKSKINNVSNYDNIIALKMSADDSYELFSSSNFTSNADDNTVVLYTGSKKPTLLRPYIINDEIINKFSKKIKGD